MIDIDTRTAGDVHILDLTGKFRAHAERTFWNAVQKSVVEQGARSIILNFKQLEEIDSYAISELLRVRASLLNLRGRMRIVNVNALVARVFHITKVDEVFEISPSEEAVLSEWAVEPA